MSTYDDASLVLVPSGYKNGVVFSQKPMDANGQLTFTRASDATRVGPNGYIEKVRENLLTYSNTFSDAFWLKLSQGVGSVAVVTPNYTTDPFGGNNAWRFQCNLNGGTTSNDRSWMIKNFTSVSTSVVSIYIKLNVAGSKTIVLSDSGGGTQTITSTEWTRISGSVSGGSGEFRIGLIGGASSDTLDASIAFAQAEAGDVATDYIATTTAAVSVGPVSGTPRLDYLDSDCPRLLLEPQRSNIATFSETFSNYPLQNVTITSNATTSPDGYANADKLIPTTTSGFHSVDYLPSVIVTTYTLSVFAKAGEYSKIAVLTNNRGSNMARGFDLNNGTTFANDFGYGEPTSFAITNYGNGWYRCSITFPKTSTGTSGNGIAVVNNAGATTFAGNGTDGVFIYGFQMEPDAAYATSYIPTLGTAVTRVADMSGATDYFGAQTFAGDFTFFVDLLPLEGNTGTSDAMILGGGDYNGGGNYRSYFRFAFGTIVLYGVGEALIISRDYTMNANQQYKILVTRTGTSVKIFANGAQVGASATSSTSVILRSLGWSYIQANYNYDGGINQVLLMPKGLTDAQAIELTTL